MLKRGFPDKKTKQKRITRGGYPPGSPNDQLGSAGKSDHKCSLFLRCHHQLSITQRPFKSMDCLRHAGQVLQWDRLCDKFFYSSKEMRILNRDPHTQNSPRGCIKKKKKGVVCWTTPLKSCIALSAETSIVYRAEASKRIPPHPPCPASVQNTDHIGRARTKPTGSRKYS